MRNSWAVPGAQCKCIDATWRSTAFFDDDALPIVGQTYTVRDVVLPDGKTVCIRLEEIVNPLRDFEVGMVECSFAAWHFRPLVPNRSREDNRRQLVDVDA